MIVERSRAVIERLSPDEWPATLAALERLVEALEYEGYLPRSGDKGGS